MNLLEDRARIVGEGELQSLGKAFRKEGKRVVFTSGAYDLIHSGQAHFLAEARTWGDILIVGISSDISRRKLRGIGHPLVGERERAETLSFLRSVSGVTIVNEQNLISTLSSLQPDVFFTIKDDWKAGIRSKEEKMTVENYGGKVVKAERLEPFISSSEVVEKLARSSIKRRLKHFFGEELGFVNNETAPYIDLGRQTPRDLLSYAYLGEVVPWKSLADLRERLRGTSKRVVFVSGSYDLVHIGHARFIEKARSWGDVLVVGIPSDKVIRKLKGLGRPVVSETSRAELLRFFRAVDYVTILPQPTVVKALKLLKPDIFQTVVEKWNKNYEKSPEYEIVRSYGGEVKLVGRQAPSVSSHVLINRAAGLRVREIFKKCLEASAEGFNPPGAG